jgi:hypothetical protein
MSAMPITDGVGFSSSRKSNRRAIHRAARLQRACCLESLEARLYLSTAAYTFQNVNIPAGGFVTGIFYDPHNQNVMYARTDVGGLYKSVNDGGYWSQLLNWVGGNTSGSGNGTQFQEFGVLSFAIDPENSNNLYAMVGEYAGTNGDVLYSNNAGATWSTTSLSFWVGGNSDGRAAGERIAVDPYDSNIILLGSNANGLWESTNAGQSFAQLTSLSTSASVNFVYFDPHGGTAGTPTKEIFVGENSTASGTNLYESTNDGTSFTEVTGTGSAPTGWMPNRTALASDGNLYLAYGNAQAPDSDVSNGGVFRYNTSTGAWANISPVVPQITNGQYDQFGYVGLALDPNSSTTLVVASFDRYNFDDNIWRTTNANTSSPSWVTLYDDVRYQGYNSTRNTTNAPYMASSSDGIGNWASDVAINPFNSAQIMHTYGGGIWATNDGNSTSTLTAANSWYFPDNGIGMTAVLGLAAANGGTPLYSGMGDVGGFAFTTVAFSPSQGNVYFNGGGGNGSSVDSAGLAPQDAVLVGNIGTTDGSYTTNGSTYTAFAGNPGGSSPYSNGTVAMSANGSTIVWAPSGEGPYYSTNNGASWSATNLVASVSSITQTGGVPTVVTSAANNFAVGQYVTISGATPSAYDGTYVIASIVNSTTFTYTDSNVTSSTATPATGTITASLNGTVFADKVNPNYFYFWTENASDNSWTLYISNNGGQTFSPSAGGALGTGNVTLVVNPTVAGQLWLGTYVGIYESTNFGASFSHPYSYSTNVSSLAVGAAAPGSSYPAIYMYGTPAGDSFEGIYRSDDGGNTWVLLNSTSQQWGGTGPLAADPNVFGRVYIAAGGIIMGNPTTSLPSNWLDQDINEPGNPGWATSSTTLSNGTTVNQWNLAGGGAGFSSTPIAISSLSRIGGVATAITSTASGLQVGQTITISGATNSAYDGTFVVTGLYNTTAGLSSDIGAATEFTFAIAGGTDTASGTITATLDDQFNFAYQPITGSAAISAQIHSITNADENNGTPQAGVMYRASTNPDDPFFTVVQTSAGSLVLEYRTTTGGGITTQNITGIPVGSEYVEIVRNGSNFTGFYSSSGTTWTQIGSSVAITAMPATANAGLMATASYNPQLTDATFSNVVVNMGPSVANAAAVNPNPVTGTSTALSALGSENGSGSGLTYTWSYTGPTGVTYTGNANGTNAAQNITANFTQAGSYNFTATITDSVGLFTTTSVNVTVQQTATNIVVSPSSTPVVPVGLTQQFSATATDQFGNSISSPSFTWGITGSGNSIDGTGDATFGSTPGSFTVTASIGSAQAMANIITENFAVPAGSTLDINLGTTGPVAVTATGGNITASQNGVQITLSGFTGVTVTGTASNDVLNFNGPLALPFTFVNCGSSALNVNSGRLTFASAAAPISLDTLNIVAGATVDLTDNAMIVLDGSLSAITKLIAEGFNGGYWNGTGIVSSTAAGTNDMGLGVALNSGGTSGTSYTAFEGQPVTSTDVLVKYTYFGDALLTGSSTAADYLQIDNAFDYNAANPTTPLTGWFNGDFNYDGVINGDDYTLIDNAYNSQGSVSFAALPASLIASNTTQIASTSKVSTVAVRGTTDTRQLAATVGNPINGDDPDAQELKKRRSSAWEMLES